MRSGVLRRWTRRRPSWRWGPSRSPGPRGETPPGCARIPTSGPIGHHRGGSRSRYALRSRRSLQLSMGAQYAQPMLADHTVDPRDATFFIRPDYHEVLGALRARHRCTSTRPVCGPSPATGTSGISAAIRATSARAGGHWSMIRSGRRGRVRVPVPSCTWTPPSTRPSGDWSIAASRPGRWRGWRAPSGRRREASSPPPRPMTRSTSSTCSALRFP